MKNFTLFLSLFIIILSLNVQSQNKVYTLNGNIELQYVQWMPTDTSFLVSYKTSSGDAEIGTLDINTGLGTALNINTPALTEDLVRFEKSLIGNYYYGTYGSSTTLYLSKKDSLMQDIFTKRFTVNSFNDKYQMQLIEFADSSLMGLAGKTIYKFKKDGTLQYKKDISDVLLLNIHKINNTEVIISGRWQYGNGLNSLYDFFVCRMDSAANIVWIKSIGTNNNEKINASSFKNGYIYLAGSTTKYGAPGVTSPNLVKMDVSGNLIWGIYAPLLNRHEISSIAINNNNEICAIIKDIYNPNCYYGYFDPTGQLQYCSSLKMTQCPLLSEFNDNEFLLGGKNNLNEALICITSGKRPATCLADSLKWISFYDWITVENTLQSPQILQNSTLNSVAPATVFTTINSFNSCPLNCAISAEINCSKSIVCLNDSIVFTAQGNNIISTSWLIDQVPVSAAAGFTYYTLNAGLHQITLIASNGTCTDTAEIMIQVLNPATPAFSWQSHLLDFTFKPINNTEQGNWLWTFGDGDSVTSSDSVRHLFESAGIYNVCAISQNVCPSQTLCQNVVINYPSDHSFNTQLNVPGGPVTANSVIQLKNGHYLIGGQTEFNFTSPSGFIYELDSAGQAINMLDQQMVLNTNSDYQYVSGFKQKKDGNVLFTGYHTYFLSGTKHIYGEINGDLVPNTKYISANSIYDYDSKIIPGKHQNSYFAHAVQGTTILGEYNAAMQIVWRTELASSNSVKKLFQLNDESLLLVCAASGNTGIGIVHTSPTGQVIDSRTFTLSSGSLSPFDAILCANGELVISGSDGNNPVVFRCDVSGNIIWSKKFNYTGGSYKQANCIIELQDGRIAGCVTEGFSATSGPSFIFSLDAGGNLISFKKDNARIIQLSGTADTSAVALLYVNTVGIGYTMCKFNRSLENPCYFNVYNASVQNLTINSANWSSMVNGFLYTTTGSGIGSYFNYAQPVSAVSCYQTYGVPEANFTWGNACAGDTVYFTNTSSGSVVNSTWSFSSSLNDGLNGQNAWAIWSVPGIYNITLSVTDSAGHVSILTQQITVGSAPVLNLSDTYVCTGSSVTLNSGAGTGNFQIHWSPSNGLSDTISAVVSANPQINTMYTVTVQTPQGCSSTDSSYVSVLPLPVLTAVIPDTICMTDSVRFYGSGAPYLNWYANGIPVGGTDTTAWMIFGSDVYITLYGTDSAGCMNSYTQWMIQDTCQIVTGIEKMQNPYLVIYPVPAQNNLFIVNSSNTLIKFTIYDYTGIEVLTDAVLAGSTFDLNCTGISNGVYTLQYINDNKKNKIKFIVVK